MNKKFLLSVISIAAVSTFAIHAGIAQFGHNAVLKNPKTITREAKPVVRPAAPTKPAPTKPAPAKTTKKVVTAEAKKKAPVVTKPSASKLVAPKTKAPAKTQIKKAAPIIKKIFKKAIPKIKSTYFKSAVK